EVADRDDAGGALDEAAREGDPREASGVQPGPQRADGGEALHRGVAGAPVADAPGVDAQGGAAEGPQVAAEDDGAVEVAGLDVAAQRVPPDGAEQPGVPVGGAELAREQVRVVVGARDEGREAGEEGEVEPG